jgi:uncharacterized membrane protein (UPF0136 family)
VNRTWLRASGSLIVSLGIVGFLTVADDLRHLGEVLGVGSVFLIGALLVGAGQTRSEFARNAMCGIACGLAVGGIVGVAIDNMPVSLGSGLAIGAAVAFGRDYRKRSSRREMA